MKQTRLNPEEKKKQANRSLSRREALQVLAAASGMVIPSLPEQWVKPFVEAGRLPVHAQISGPTATTTSTPTLSPNSTATATPNPGPSPIPTRNPPLGNEFAVMGTASGANEVLVFPRANTNLPAPTQNIIPGLPSNRQPHGVAYFGDAGGLISDFSRSRVFVVDLMSSTLVDTIATPSYNGMGTIAVAPGSTHALAASTNTTLTVLQEPFNASSTQTTVVLPGSLRSYQTQAIVFDNMTRQAFVHHNQAISVLDYPYSSVAFTIPLPYNNTSTGAIAISSDGQTLLTTNLSNDVYIFHAPFSAASTPETLTINAPAGLQLDGIFVAPPNNDKALVCNSDKPNVLAISAPFSSTSIVEELPLPADFSSGPGFEDIGINSDGTLAIITGNHTSGADRPAAFIQTPFTAAGATTFAINIPGGRGAGAVRFQPTNS